MKTPIQKLINIGPKVADGLAEIGITTEEGLREIGAVEAFLRLRLIRLHWNTRCYFMLCMAR